MKPNSPVFPPEFLCPISLELMTDPVIVATGQTYERSCIQKWIQSGHRTCPKTQQILQHADLIPNYVLRSLIEDWCKSNSVELSNRSSSSRSGEASGSQIDKSADPATVNVLLQKLASGSPENRREAAGELRLLSKTDAENRISIAEGGAIPLLVNLLSTPDATTQEHAVTALLNLSISENNKGAIVMAGGIGPIVEVLKNGRMQARENAAAALFSLSALDDNKSVIGESDAIPALVGLLSEGSQRGKKDAASALFNLSIYRDNKARAVRAGAVGPLMQLLVDPGAGMVGEALTTLAILAGHPEGIMAIGNAEAIPILVDLIRSGCPRNRENAAVVLLALCITDPRHLVTARRQRVSEPLTDLVENGTERAQRKATSLLELISKSEQADLISRAQELRVISDSE